MKRFFLTVIILFVAGIMVSAQQAATQNASGRPSSGQIKETARQFLSQARSNASQFDATQSDLNTRSVSNSDASTYYKLRNEIEALEASIREEQKKMSGSLERGQKIKQATLDRVQQLIDQHKAKLTELEAFTR
jgi:cell division protein FtsL